MNTIRPMGILPSAALNALGLASPTDEDRRAAQDRLAHMRELAARERSNVATRNAPTRLRAAVSTAERRPEADAASEDAAFRNLAAAMGIDPDATPAAPYTTMSGPLVAVSAPDLPSADEDAAAENVMKWLGWR